MFALLDPDPGLAEKNQCRSETLLLCTTGQQINTITATVEMDPT
jgi:hypothetical protein